MISSDSDSVTDTESGGDSDSDWLNEVRPRNQRKSKKRKRRNTGNHSISDKLRESIRRNAQLPVICGDKEGTLHKKKYDNGETCIFSEGRWFTPNEFEKFGGKAKNKKWKTSIVCYGVSLQTLIWEHLLSTSSFRLKCSQAKERRRELSKSRRSSRHKAENGHASKFHGPSQTSSEQNSIVSDEESEDDVSELRGDSFPVRCCRGKGFLHVKRLATATCGKCIRTNNAWLTPEEFLNQNMPSGNWRRDIEGRGIPLGQLIMNRVLTLHTLNCNCPICTRNHLHLLDQNHDDVCFMCKTEGDLVTCKKCPRAFHHHCHIPTLLDDTIGETWKCCFCIATEKRCYIVMAKLHIPQSVSREREASP